MKRILCLAVAIVLTVSTLPATDGQPIDPCDTDLTLLAYELAWDELDTTVENPSPTPQSGGLVLDFVLDGVRHQWWFALDDVPAESTWHYTIRFSGLIAVIGIDICASRPGGIVDAPDPVARNVGKKKKND